MDVKWQKQKKTKAYFSMMHLPSFKNVKKNRLIHHCMFCFLGKYIVKIMPPIYNSNMYLYNVSKYTYNYHLNSIVHKYTTEAVNETRAATFSCLERQRAPKKTKQNWTIDWMTRAAIEKRKSIIPVILLMEKGKSIIPVWLNDKSCHCCCIAAEDHRILNTSKLNLIVLPITHSTYRLLWLH